MIFGSRVHLRTWKDEDISKLRALRNDVALQSKLLSRPKGSSEECVRIWLQGFSTTKTDLLFIISKNDNDDVLGYVQVKNIDFISNHAELGICLRSDSQGIGLGGDVLDLIRQYMYNVMGVIKIWLRVREDNLAAIRCYEKSGFALCGKLTKHFYDSGKLVDVLVMESFYR